MMVYFLLYSNEKRVHLDFGGFRKPWEIAEHIHRSGKSVKIFAPKGHGPRSATALSCVRFSLRTLPVLRPLWAYGMLFLLPLLHALKDKPDWIYFRTGFSVLPILLARLIRAKILLEFNGDSIGEALSKEGRLTLRLECLKQIEGFNARHADIIIALTEGLKLVLINRYRVNPEKIMVIPSGTNTDLFHPLDRSECRRKTGLPTDSFVVSFLGVLYKHQGVQILAQAASQLIQQKPDVHFLIGGDGPYRKDLEHTVEKLGLNSCFRFLGNVPYEEAPIIIGAGDVCVAPFLKTRGETSPLKIFDYLACGRPVIASDLSCLRWVTDSSGAVLLVPPEDPMALAGAILNLLEDKQRRIKMAEKGRAWVQSYSWREIAKQTLSGLQKVREYAD